MSQFDHDHAIRPKDRFLVVTDAYSPDCTFSDILFETDLAGLRLQFLGGLTMDEHPTIYTSLNSEHAYRDARQRLNNARKVQR